MKRYDTTPFDTQKLPPKQNLFFLPFFWLFSLFYVGPGSLKIHKVRMKGVKPPYLVLATHQSFLDFPVSQLSLFPHRINYVSELEGFEAYGEWFYRQMGCLGTRKFICDLNLISNIRRVMNRGGILVLYPEARYANVGTNSQLPESVSKLIKILKVPVVTLNMKGNYLRSPIWNLKRRHGVTLDATVTLLLNVDECADLSAKEIQNRVQKALSYDEYAYQKNSRMKIADPKRAEGLEQPLYHCPVCGVQFQMASSGSRLCCNACKAAWDMDEYGVLSLIPDSAPGKVNPFPRIPDWYEWERQAVKEEIDGGAYSLDIKVRIEALPNAKNFIPLGDGRLKHGPGGFDLTLREYGSAGQTTIHFSTKSMTSIHTEYDYRGKGPCVTLSTHTNTYFLFPVEEGFNATRIQFATEYFYEVYGKRH